MGQTRTIIRRSFACIALLSPFFFPIGVSIFLAIVGAFVTPVLPFAVGVIIDALFYSGGAYAFPVWSVIGLFASIAAVFVHRFVETSIMRS